MDESIAKFNLKDLRGRDARLLQEWIELDTLCSKRKAKAADPFAPSISYIIRRKNAMGLPVEYEIWYRVKSIVGVKDTPAPREPIYGYLHKMRIVLPNNYPAADGNPLFTFITDIWHPNVRSAGSFKGHVCLTIKEMGVMASLKDLVLRVERYLTYQYYHAKNTPPYPEDQNVAEWVREEAEPNGWTRFNQDREEPKPAQVQSTPQTENTEPPKIKVRRI
ncbi:MAG: hypothetical protein J1D77_00895 [Muribaculaceae bacterium]|nr:hypothetical protein [Muribaculaceae bacterium]